MALTLVNQLSEWNPQLFRELKGRLNPRNILIAVVTSLLGQLLLLMSFTNLLPTAPPMGEDYTPISNRYCTGEQLYSSYLSKPICLRIAGDSFGINWQLWWQDVFVWLSILGIFALLVGGTYLLVNDLSKEEHRGTLNFLRLTPESSPRILIGKLLGVPSLLYLVGFLALPLHYVAGLSGQIPLSLILGYYSILGASCLFFYSVALLFGLVGSWLGSFQVWLGSGAVLMFLSFMTVLVYNRGLIFMQSPTDWLTLFAPLTVLPYLMTAKGLGAAEVYQIYNLEDLQWFYLPVGASAWSAMGLMLLNYGLWTYWVWQGLKRCFHNPSGTLLSKQKSYWLTACFEVMILEFSLRPENASDYPKGLFDSLTMLLVFNLLLFLGLIAALSPHRQAMQDWARYRHQQRTSRKGGVMQDLIWAEKSPALIAVGLNLAIAFAILLPWVLLWPESEYKIPALWGLLLNATLIFVYAAVAQLLLLMKTPKRAAWAAVTVGVLIVLPPIIFNVLSLTASVNPGIWLFSAFPWVSVEQTTGTAVFLAIIGQSLTVTLLSIQLTRQLRKAGESATKALLSGRPSV